MNYYKPMYYELKGSLFFKFHCLPQIWRTFLALLTSLSFLIIFIPLCVFAKSADAQKKILAFPENLDVDPTRGTAVSSIPILTPQGRGEIQPAIALTYNSSSSKSFVGLGWMLELGKIERSTKFGVPTYNNLQDTFVLLQSGSQQELVDISGNATEFRARFEGAFMKLELIREAYWIATGRNGVKYFFGTTNYSREFDPNYNTKRFSWRLDRVEDLNGNYMTISYIREYNRLYPNEIFYTGNVNTSETPYAKIKFLYETNRDDVGISFLPGYESYQTNLKLVNIDVRVDENLLRRYALKHTQSSKTKRTLLTRITQIGSDGVSELPPMIFEYSEELVQFNFPVNMDVKSHLKLSRNLSRFLDMNGDNFIDILQGEDSYNSPYYIYFNQGDNTFADRTVAVNTTSLEKLNHPDVRFYDLNADGLVDIIYGKFSPYKVYLNNGINGFHSGITINHSPKDPISKDNLIQILDMNSDGYADMVETFRGIGEDWKIFFNDGNGDFLAPIIAVNSPFVGTSNPDVQFADFNRDGGLDVAYSSTNPPYRKIWINNGVDGFHSGINVSFPTNYGLSSPYIQLADMNGDGLTDVLEGPIPGNPKYYIRLNNGRNGFNDRFRVRNSATFPGLDEQHVKLIDINNDSLRDLVYGPPNGMWKVWLNNGVNGFQDAIVIDQHPSTHGLSAEDITVGDINGDGLLDLIDGDSYNVWTNKTDVRSPKTNVLVKVDNSLGGITDIHYTPERVACLLGPQEKYTYNPVVFNTIKRVIRSALGDHFSTKYIYKNCFWNFEEREWRGFEIAKIIDGAGNYKEVVYLQDDIFKGRIATSKNYSASGELLQETINSWNFQTLYPGVSFVFLESTDHFTYGNDGEVRRTAQDYFYDESPQYGNLTKTIQYGEVDASSGDDIGDDQIIIKTDYHNNPKNWLLGIPTIIRKFDQNDMMIRKTTFYYDGHSNTNILPTKGHLTVKVEWAGNDPDPITQYEYDLYSNLVTTTDANGNVTTLTYDSQYHLFPIKTVNAKGHSVVHQYYGVDGVPLDNGDGYHGLWGQLKNTTDPNHQQGSKSFDAFGRLTASVGPNDSIDKPTVQIEYDFNPSYMKVVTRNRVEHGEDTTLDSYEFFDGLGRLIQRKDPSGDPNQHIVSGQTLYNERGLPKDQYLPFLSNNAIDTIETIDRNRPHTTLHYDEQGRVTETINPDDTYTTAIYNGDWMIKAIDPNGHMQNSIFDSYGRLIEKQEFLGADGRSSYYPASSYQLYATTRYTYDILGNLIQTKDAHGNSTSINYNQLGRKVSMTDPSMGMWTYFYDKAGNLLYQIDGKGQRIDFEYDELNRLISKHDQSQSLNAVYTYDELVNSFATGRLTSVKYGKNDHVDFDFDNLGREISSTKMIDGISYNVEREYNALDQLKTLTYPDGTKIFYSYDQSNRIRAIADGPMPLSEETESEEYVPAVYLKPPFTYFPLNDNSNTSKLVVDYGKDKNNGISKRLTHNMSTGGHIDRAFYFDGPTSGNCVKCDELGKTLVTHDLGSLSFWIKNPQTWRALLAISTDRGDSQAMIRISGGAITWIIEANGKISSRSANHTFSNGNWHHVCLVQTGIELKCYVDGNEIKMYGRYDLPSAWFGLLSGNFVHAGFGCRIGRTGKRDLHYNGLVDDFRIYDHVLSEDEIVALFANGNGTEESTPKYRFKNFEKRNNDSAEDPVDLVEDATDSIPLPSNIYVANVKYNEFSQIEHIIYGNGTETFYSYNPLNLRLEQLQTINAQGELIQDFYYEFDEVGNIVAIKDNLNTASQTFEYDALNRLIRAEALNSYGIKSYEYDEVGNILAKDNRSYNYGERGFGPYQVTSLSDGSWFDYDSNGNMTLKVNGDGNTTEYFYDKENRLIEVLRNGQSIAFYEYDGDGGRTKATFNGGAKTIRFVGSLYEEEQGVCATKFIFMGDTRVASITNDEPLFYHSDHLNGAIY